MTNAHNSSIFSLKIVCRPGIDDSIYSTALSTVACDSNFARPKILTPISDAKGYCKVIRVFLNTDVNVTVVCYGATFDIFASSGVLFLY